MFGFCFLFHFIQSNKFDDQCAQFTLHEDLDASGAVITATLDNVSGDISGLSLSASGDAGLIPLTVPSANAVRRPVHPSLLSGRERRTHAELCTLC